MKEYKITLEGQEFTVLIKNLQKNEVVVEVEGKEYHVGIQSTQPDVIAPLQVKPIQPATPAPASAPKMTSPAAGGEGAVSSPLPGVVLDILVKPGDTVKMGQPLLILEAMKMENEIKADRDGTIKEVLVNKGDSVLEGAALIKIGG
ncbi:MAG: biotin/lipoyl-binding protein [Calditrichia bacterium]